MMSGARFFSLDSCSPQLHSLARRMARATGITAGQMALTAREAGLLIREMILTGPAGAIDSESLWMGCYSQGSFTILGENVTMAASAYGTQLRWIRCSFNDGISWHIDFHRGGEGHEASINPLIESPVGPRYELPQMFMRIRVIQGTKVTADCSYDELSENSSDEMDWRSRLPGREARKDVEDRFSGDSDASGEGAGPVKNLLAGGRAHRHEIITGGEFDGEDFQDARQEMSVITARSGPVCPCCGNDVPQSAGFCPLCGCRLPRPKGRPCAEEAAVPECTPQGIAFVKRVLTTINGHQEAAQRERLGPR